MEPRSTDELLKLLIEAPNVQKVEEILEANRENELTFSAYLNFLMNQKHVSTVDIVNQVNMERTYVYQIMNGVRNPGRDKILVLALVLGCDLDETQRLLTLGKRHKLYPKEDRDALIIYAIVNHYTPVQANEWLFEKGQDILE